MMRVVVLATVAVLSLAVGGCSAPALTFPGPPVAPTACGLDDTEITVGHARPGGRALIAFANATGGRATTRFGSTPRERAVSTIVLGPDGVLDDLRGSRAQWSAALAARAISTGKAPEGWADPAVVGAWPDRLRPAQPLAAGDTTASVATAPTISRLRARVRREQAHRDPDGSQQRRDQRDDGRVHADLRARG